MKFDVTSEFGDIFSAKLRKFGYDTVGFATLEHQENLHRLDIYKQGDFICSFGNSGVLSPSSSGLHDVQIKEILTLFTEIQESYARYRNAKPLECDGVTGYRLISEFGDIILAAQLGGDNEIRFVTWCYTYDRTGVTWGHYYDTNYEGAKRDFSSRAGLIQEKQLFDEEEFTILRDSCAYCAENEQDMSFDEERRLEKLIQKLESNMKEEE